MQHIKIVTFETNNKTHTLILTDEIKNILNSTNYDDLEKIITDENLECILYLLQKVDNGELLLFLIKNYKSTHEYIHTIIEAFFYHHHKNNSLKKNKWFDIIYDIYVNNKYTIQNFITVKNIYRKNTKNICQSNILNSDEHVQIYIYMCDTNDTHLWTHNLFIYENSSHNTRIVTQLLQTFECNRRILFNFLCHSLKYELYCEIIEKILLLENSSQRLWQCLMRFNFGEKRGDLINFCCENGIDPPVLNNVWILKYDSTKKIIDIYGENILLNTDFEESVLDTKLSVIEFISTTSVFTKMITNSLTIYHILLKTSDKNGNLSNEIFNKLIGTTTLVECLDMRGTNMLNEELFINMQKNKLYPYINSDYPNEISFTSVKEFRSIEWLCKININIFKKLSELNINNSEFFKHINKLLLDFKIDFYYNIIDVFFDIIQEYNISDINDSDICFIKMYRENNNKNIYEILKENPENDLMKLFLINNINVIKNNDYVFDIILSNMSLICKTNNYYLDYLTCEKSLQLFKNHHKKIKELITIHLTTCTSIYDCIFINSLNKFINSDTLFNGKIYIREYVKKALYRYKLRTPIEIDKLINYMEEVGVNGHSLTIGLFEFLLKNGYEPPKDFINKLEHE